MMSESCAAVFKRWSQVREFFPEDLTERAVQTKAVERFRKFRNGEELLLGSLLCALPGDTFESAAQTYQATCGMKISAPGMFLKFAQTEDFLRDVFAYVLRHAQFEGAFFSGKRVVIVDATALCGPGAKHKDQILHVLYNVSSGLPERVDLTNHRGGETFLRHHFESGDLVLADRGYPHPKGIVHVLESDASLLVRFEFESIRLRDGSGNRITPSSAKSQIGKNGSCEFEAYVEGWERPLRVLGCLNPNGKPVWLLTDLSAKELPLKEARKLYSVRWQIELFFKRLKSLMDLDELPTRDGPSARPWIWAKLILAALAVLSTDERFSPWGGPIRA